MTTTPVHEVGARIAPAAAYPSTRWSSDRFVLRVVLGLAALYALVVGTLAVVRYQAFASDFDHGIFTQYTWLLGHLHDPFNTIVLSAVIPSDGDVPVSSVIDTIVGVAMLVSTAISPDAALALPATSFAVALNAYAPGGSAGPAYVIPW